MKNITAIILTLLIGTSLPVSAGQSLEARVSSDMGTTRYATTPQQTVVIDREEIIASGASTIADVLRGRAGIQITDTYGHGTDTIIGMRGFYTTANANVLVLVDGHRLNNIDSKRPTIGLISLNEVERIEFIQGSQGVLYGNQAVGGVINIITRRFEPGQREVSIGTGSYDKATARFGQGGRLSQRYSGVSTDHAGIVPQTAAIIITDRGL